MVHLHEKDVCHRDIRGSNILLTTDGKVKLIDFGISQRVENNKKMKNSFGSSSWMAPEMIPNQTKKPVEYDKKVDVWALGKYKLNPWPPFLQLSNKCLPSKDGDALI